MERSFEPPPVARSDGCHGAKAMAFTAAECASLCFWRFDGIKTVRPCPDMTDPELLMAEAEIDVIWLGAQEGRRLLKR